MGRGKEVDARCPDCKSTRKVIVRYSHQSPHTLCPECVKAIKGRRFDADTARRLARLGFSYD